MINLTHAGYELVRVYNLTNPTRYDHPNFLDKLKWAIVKQPKYSGRVYKKDQPDLDIWSDSDVYFTFYKGRGRINKGDRMVCFYMRETPIDIHNLDWGDEDEPLY